MSYNLDILTRSDHRIFGRWYDGRIDRWFPFKYTKDGNTGLWQGTFDLVVGKFYEYDVRIECSPQVSGSGSNRFGDFTLSSLPPVDGEDVWQWTKTYDVVRCPPRPPVFVPLAERRKRTLARMVRIAFKDRRWQLEREIIMGKKSLVDVKKEIAGDQCENTFNGQLWMLLVSRQRTELIRRHNLSREGLQLMTRIARLRHFLLQNHDKPKTAPPSLSRSRSAG